MERQQRQPRGISLGYAQHRLATVLSDDLDLDYHLDERPRGNCTWKIVVEIVKTKPLCNRQSESIQGFLACHQWAGLTTFAVNVEGREFWFDQLDPALELLASNVRSW
jgi:hypothetical protein